MLSPHTDQLGRVVTFALPAGAAIAEYLDESNAQNITARAGAAEQVLSGTALRPRPADAS